jgi:hypothetical protein
MAITTRTGAGNPSPKPVAQSERGAAQAVGAEAAQAIAAAGQGLMGPPGGPKRGAPNEFPENNI